MTPRQITLVGFPPGKYFCPEIGNIRRTKYVVIIHKNTIRFFGLTPVSIRNYSGIATVCYSAAAVGVGARVGRTGKL